MEYTMYGEPVETFEDVIQQLANFKNCALNLSERYKELEFSPLWRNTIEDKLQRYLKHPQNIQTLQSYIRILKRISDKKIREALPDGYMKDEMFFSFEDNSEVDKGQEEEKNRKAIRKQIDYVIAFIAEVLNRHKTTSVKTKYIDNPAKPKIKHTQLKAFETKLVNGQLIERHMDFLRIFRGQAPNERINWIGSPSSFKYFIDELFKIEPFKNEKQKWVVASNTFTINGSPTPINIHRHKAKDANKETKIIINVAISYLTD